jgi:hypothetical protein
VAATRTIWRRVVALAPASHAATVIVARTPWLGQAAV